MAQTHVGAPVVAEFARPYAKCLPVGVKRSVAHRCLGIRVDRGRIGHHVYTGSKAPAPLVEVPAPRWICTSRTDDTRSGILTQYTRWLSESLIGTPLAVTLMREASVPLTLIAE